MNRGLQIRMRRLIACFLVVVVVVTGMPADFWSIFAANDFAKMNGRSYSDFDDFVEDLEDMRSQTVTIEMLRDWNAASDSDFDTRVIIPTNSTVTLNMNGYMISRDRTANGKDKWEGELIYISEGAKLTINGGNSSISHTVKAYVGTNRKSYGTKDITVYGGLLTGANNAKGGGAIVANQSSTITLNDVTIAGCRSEQYLLSHGNGGGISLYGDGTHSYGNISLTMNNSTITGCYAYNEGGGLYSNTTKNRIVLNNSHIDDNYSGTNGGGVGFNYAAGGYLKGDRKSTISGNEAADDGGAIYINEEELDVSGLILEGNRAKNGGAIYSNDDTITMSNLVIWGNAAERGGGIYINKQKNTISNCDITNNRASISGGGVYVSSNIDTKFNVTGATVIKDNPGNGSNNNLYMSDSDPDDNRVNFSLIKGADVHIGYYDTEDKGQIMITQGKVGDTIKSKDCSRFITADNSGYYIYFDPAPNSRKLYYKKGSAAPVKAPVNVAADDAGDAFQRESSGNNVAGIVGTVGAGGVSGSDYNLIRGFYTHEETDNGVDDRTGVFYYSDALFDADPSVYNDHLATTSWVMAFAGTYLRKFEEEDANGNTYYNKHAGARQFMADIGCPDQNIYVNDSLINKPTTDSIGVTIASKELEKANGEKTGYILIPVTVRGGGYEAEWASNVTLGTSGEAEGFANAANQVTGEIDKYIEKYKLRDELEEGKVKFWVVGFSRAGATANLTAKRLIEKYANGSGEAGKNNQVFAYPCEAAKGGTDAAQELEDDKYFCIHNLINKTDVVPLVAPTQMGFKRYGVDHYIPGTAAADVPDKKVETVKRTGGAEATVTTYSDNSQLYTKTDAYNKFRDGKTSLYGKSIYDHLDSIDPNLIFDDYFHPMAMNFFPKPKVYEEGDYDDNRVEDFIEDFIRFFQEGMSPSEMSHYSQAVSSRKVWAEEKTSINNVSYTTIQSAMRDTMALVFSMDEENTTGFIDRASTIMDKIPSIGGSGISMREMYDDLIGEWNKLSGSNKEKYVKFFWNHLKDSGALDYLDTEEVTKLEKNWPTVANMLFRFVDGDYKYDPGDHTDLSKWAHGMDRTMTYVPTFATFSSYILMNHYPEVNIAWTRMSDDWYTDARGDFEVYKIVAPGSVEAPTATGTTKKVTGIEEVELVPAESDPEKNSNRLIGDQKLILENRDIVGEAIYYDLSDITNGEDSATVLSENQLYRGGVALTLGDETNKSYKLTTYDMSYGVRSAKVDYYINIGNGKHDVIVRDEVAGEDRLYKYSVADKVSIAAKVGDRKIFDFWTVTDESVATEAGGVDVTNVIFAGDYEKYKNRGNATFIMPDEGAEGIGNDYKLMFKANYRDRISEIATLIDAPVAGQSLDTDAVVSFNTVEGSYTYPVVWTYSVTEETDDGTVEKTVVDSGNAYNSTAYTATVTIPMNPEQYIAFTSDVAGTVNEETAVATKYDSDGHATVSFTFPATAESGGEEAPEELINVKLKAYDMNLGTVDENMTVDLYAKQGQMVSIAAIDVPNEKFIVWDGIYYNGDVYSRIDVSQEYERSISIQIPEGLTSSEVIVQADYIPLVNNIAVTVDTPEGGTELSPAVTAMDVTVSNTYSIAPECVELTWTPEPLTGESGGKIADYEVPYTANVKLRPYSDGEYADKIKATRLEDGQEVYMAAVFFYADNVTASVNGFPANLDDVEDVVSYTFPTTKYKLAADVEDPSDVYGIPHGADLEAVSRYLPKTVKIRLDNGIEADVIPEWTLVPEIPADQREEVIWTATGVVTLPDIVENPYEYDTTVTMNLVVDEAAHAASPDAELASGKYLYDQVTSLSTDTEGGAIWYTTDGSDPTVSDTSRLYEGESISIRREDLPEGETSITIRAYTIRDGLWDSNISTYVYEFTNEVPIPMGADSIYDGEAKIGVSGSEFYTLSGEGITIDKNGNVVATDAGTYTVRAKINEGFVWLLEEGTDGADSITGLEDQIIVFTISPVDITEAAELIAEEKYDSVDELKKALRVMLDETELVQGRDYDISITQTSDGEVTVTVTGKGNYTGTVTGNYQVSIEEPAHEHDWDEGRITTEPTCTEKGVRTYTCRLDSSHTKTEDIPALGHDWSDWTVTKEATETEEGEEIRTCRRCGEKETRAIPVSDENAVTYRAISGDGNVWTKGSGVTSDFRFQRSVKDEETFNRFRKVLIDGKEIEASNYEASAGSVIIKLSAAYLETLTVGEHQITVVFDDGSANAGFTVNAAPDQSNGAQNGTDNTQNNTNNKPGNAPDNKANNTGSKPAANTGSKPAANTGDEMNLGMWWFLLVASALAIVVIFEIRMKARKLKK